MGRSLFGGVLRAGSSGSAARAISFQDVWGQGLSWSELVGDARVRQMSITTTLACVDIKAATIAAMPLHEYTKVDGVRRRTPSPSELLVSPSELFEFEEWIYAAVASMTLWDQAIGLVRSTGSNGWPTRLEWLVPDQVDCRIEDGLPVFYYQGRRHLAFRHGGDVVQIRRRPIPGAAGGGLSVAKAIAPLVTVGLEGARAIAQAYMAGGLPLSALWWDGELDAAEADRMSEQFVEKRRQHPGRPLVAGKGWKFETFTRENVTQELVAIRKQVATEIAVAHSVPPELVGGESGGSMTYSNLEGLTRHLEVRTLLPIYTPLERTLSRLIPRPRYARFNADASVRTSLIDRMRANDIAIRAGVRSPDEARALDEQPPIPDGRGDVFLWPPYATSPEVRNDPQQ